MKPRPPKLSDFKKLRGLHAAAGNEHEFLRWYALALEAKPSGGPKRKDRLFSLIEMEMLCRAAQRDFRVPRRTAIRAVVRGMGMRGQSEDAIVERFAKRLRDPKFKCTFQEKVQVIRFPRRNSCTK
jgi:hypothetical protein